MNTLQPSIESFLKAWGTLQPERTPTQLIDRLASFTSGYREYRRKAPSSGSGRPASQLTLERLQAAVDPIGDAFRQARASGAFVNPWRAAGIGRSERRNADVLAWLLDPREDHGLGHAPLEGLYDAVQAASPECPRPSRAVDSNLQVEERPMHRTRDRVDLVIYHDELALFIEIKIGSGEGPQQLSRYAEAAEHAARCGAGVGLFDTARTLAGA